MSKQILDRVDEFRKILRQRLTELETLNTASASSRETVALDQSKVGRLSRMDAMQAKEMAAETGRRRKLEMQRIKAAFARIENEDFGRCVKCDEEIGIKRLENDPSTPLCIDCARK